jgi:hypothetical protein
MKTITVESESERAGTKNNSWLEIVRQHVGSTRFGVVQIVIHESRVVQIERTEKVRLANPATGPSGGE